MAKNRDWFNLFNRLSGSVDVSSKRAALMRPSAVAITTEERDKVINVVARAQTQLHEQRGDSLLNYLRASTRQVADRRRENIQIIQMAPEVQQAANIVVPSIMSPNNLQRGEVAITSTANGLSEQANLSIGQYLTEYFNKDLRYSTNLPKWIRESLYKSGAKAVMLVPVSELDRQFNSSRHFVNSGQESLNTPMVGEDETYQKLKAAIEGVSLFGLNEERASGYGTTKVEFTDGAMESAHAAMESVQLYELEKKAAPQDSGNPSTFSYHRPEGTALKGALENIRSGFTSNTMLAVTDNPDVLKADKLIRKKTGKKMEERIGLRYKENGFVSLRATVKDTDEGNPLVMELPTESVIPLHVPGDPENHIGYFVALDEFGNPIDSAQAAAVPALPDSMSAHFNELFRAYGIADFQPAVPAHYTAMNRIYQEVVSSYLTDRLDAIGLPNLSIGADNSVFRAMLARYFHNRRTRLLFVPKELMVYLAFQYNDNGTGRSKLEDIKFTLSLRITLLVCQMMSAVNNAIDRKKLKVNFASDFTGNILEHMNMIRDEAVHKNTVAYSFDADAVSRMLADRSYTVEASGIPGLDQYSVSSEPNSQQAQPIDDVTVQDVRRLLGLGLSVPPTALDSLSENEYSRSIATTNLFFALTIAELQEVVCRTSGDFVRKYISFSKQLQDEIRKLIGSQGKKVLEKQEKKAEAEEKDTEAETKDSDKDSDDVDQKIADADSKSGGDANEISDDQMAAIIAGILVKLPPPNVAPDKTQFENLESFVQSISTIFDALFGDDLANGKPELVEVLSAKRTLAKSDAVREYMSTIGLVGVSIPDLMRTSPKEMLELRQHLLHLARALKTQEAATGSSDAAAAPSGGGMY